MKNNIDAISFDFINQCTEILEVNEFVEMSENRFHNQIRSVVSECVDNGIRLIRLAGPSGAGKTTSCKLVVEAIKQRGIPAYYLSMDNWYKTITVDELPRNEDGDPDYESPELIDIEGFKSDAHKLLSGEEIELREFDFKNRISKKSGKKIKCEDNGIVVIEGLHAINPIFDIDEETLKVYVEPSNVRFNDGTILTSSNIRLCRRMHRDIADRGMSFEDTMKKCRSVDRGQDKYIEPYTNDARILKVDTLMFYELFIHKNALSDLEYLRKIPDIGITEKAIPKKSLLREFYKNKKS